MEMVDSFKSIHPENITLSVDTPAVSSMVRLGPQGTMLLHRWLHRYPASEYVIEQY